MADRNYRLDVEIDAATDRWLEDQGRSIGSRLIGGDPTLPVGARSTDFVAFFKAFRRDRHNTSNVPGDKRPDIELYGAIDLVAQERAAWQDLAAWYGKFITAVEEARKTYPEAGLGANPWDTWMNLVKDGSFQAKDNDRANDVTPNFWYPAGSFAGQGPTVNAPGRRLAFFYKDKNIKPDDRLVQQTIIKTKEFYESLYVHIRDTATEKAQGGSTQIAKDMSKIGQNAKSALNGNANWWEFDKVYGADGTGGKAVMRVDGVNGPAFDSVNVVSTGGSGPRTADPNLPGLGAGSDVAEPATDVYSGPPNNLPIMYSAVARRGAEQQVFYTTIPHTVDWDKRSNGAATGRLFDQPIKMARGFLRGPYGDNVSQATYKDGGTVKLGGHIFYFHYNPNAIDFSFIFNTDNTTPEQQNPLTAVGTIKGWTMGFSLLLDRAEELSTVGFQSDISALDRAYTEALSEANLASALTSAQQAGIPEEDWPSPSNTGWDPTPNPHSLKYGILYDLAVLRSVFMMSESGRGAGARFLAWFGPGLHMEGMPTNATVNYTHFTQYMVPIRAVVNISMQMISGEETNPGAGAAASIAGITLTPDGLPSDPAAVPAGATTTPGSDTVTPAAQPLKNQTSPVNALNNWARPHVPGQPWPSTRPHVPGQPWS